MLVLDLQNIKSFLMYCSGSAVTPRPKSIRIDFSEVPSGDHAVISAHTCDKSLVFPKDVFVCEEGFP